MWLLLSHILPVLLMQKMVTAGFDVSQSEWVTVEKIAPWTGGVRITFEFTPPPEMTIPELLVAVNTEIDHADVSIE